MEKNLNKRWYDPDPDVSQSIRVLESFPLEIQTIVSEGVITLAERECQAHELLNSLRSLGPDKVLAMFKSKNMRRAYDHNPTMHKAMNYFYILSQENQRFMAQRIKELLNYVVDYLRICHTYDQATNPEELSEAVNFYIESGHDEAELLLQSLEEKFNRELKTAPIMTMEILQEHDRITRVQNNRG